MAWKAWCSASSTYRMALWACGLLIGMGVWGSAPNVMAQAAQPGPSGVTSETTPSDSNAPDTVLPDTTVIPPYRPIYLPTIVTDARPRCPTISDNGYETIPVQGTLRSSSYDAATDPDVNLAIRSYATLPGLLSLVNINGPTDDNAPQLAATFRPPRVPTFSAVHRVYDWDWVCPNAPAGQGCRGGLISSPDYTALSMVTVAGETLYPPSRGPDIFPGGYIALVLYAEEEQITITYTREDSPVPGYLVHLDNFCVDPNLLSLYRALDQAGRLALPALTADDPLGIALVEPIVVAIRDTGSFMDPRSAKDWWQETAMRLRAAQLRAADMGASVPVAGNP